MQAAKLASWSALRGSMWILRFLKGQDTHWGCPTCAPAYEGPVPRGVVAAKDTLNNYYPAPEISHEPQRLTAHKIHHWTVLAKLNPVVVKHLCCALVCIRSRCATQVYSLLQILCTWKTRIKIDLRSKARSGLLFPVASHPAVWLICRVSLSSV